MAVIDPYKTTTFSATGARDADTGSDSVYVDGTTISTYTGTIPPTCRAIYVNVAGNLIVTMADGGSVVVFQNVVAGSVLPIQVSKIHASTSADVIALF
jgi:hypothetical protein